MQPPDIIEFVCMTVVYWRIDIYTEVASDNS